MKVRQSIKKHNDDYNPSQAKVPPAINTSTSPGTVGRKIVKAAPALNGNVNRS